MAVSTTFSKKFFDNILQEYREKTLKVALIIDGAGAFLTSKLNSTSFTYQDIKSPTDYEVISGDGYTTGGQIISNLAVDSINLKLTGDNVVWSNSSITSRYAVIYDGTSGLETFEMDVVAVINFDELKESNLSTFEISWGTSGIIKLTQV